MIHVYTGGGKGKTTAALGLALRACGAGFRVYIGQFIKGKACSEHIALRSLKNITVEQYGRGCFLGPKPGVKDILLAKSGLNKALKAVRSKKYKVIILDEANIALHLGLLSLKEVLELMRITPKNIELILTGRCAPAQIIRSADLASEIKEIKHYYKKGIKARRGIED
ncbi:MAG: cob(I)yrinic acid a,c-diamide adenosyltransferase [Candidatus Omnitrophica bacterium]|nr:cob(I)yrinic acid a,c-diamide adenosyltransferase [Candidatus Omnitrophota bacterium]